MPAITLNLRAADPLNESVRLAADAITRGGLILFPTETVYGVAAAALAASGVERLRRLADAPAGAPLVVHLAQPRDARNYLSHPAPVARRLMRRAWPGPLTLSIAEPHPERTAVAAGHGSDKLTAVFAAGRVVLRCPAHPVAAALLAAVAAPVVATSAARHDALAAHTFEDARNLVGDLVDVCLDAGETPLRAHSTLVRIDGNAWSIERAGAIDARAVARLARSETLFVCTGNTCRSPMAEYLFRERLAATLQMTPAEAAAAGFLVSSAGTFAHAGGVMSSGTLEVLRRRGIAGDAHRSRPLTTELIQQAERIYCMTTDHLSAVLELAPGAAGRVRLLSPGAAIADPLGGGAGEYERCAADIGAAIEARVKEIVDEDRDWQ